MPKRVKRKRKVNRGLGTLRTRILALVRAAHEAGKGDRFLVAELFPCQVTIYVGTSGTGGPLDTAVAVGLVERVADGRQWFYRLTEAGRKTARTRKLPVFQGTRWEKEDENDIGRTWSFGVAEMEDEDGVGRPRSVGVAC